MCVGPSVGRSYRAMIFRSIAILRYQNSEPRRWAAPLVAPYGSSFIWPCSYNCFRFCNVIIISSKQMALQDTCRTLSNRIWYLALLQFVFPAGKPHRRHRKGKEKRSYSKSFTKNSLDLAFKRRWYAYTQRSFREEAHGRRSIEDVFADQQQQLPPGITVLQVVKCFDIYYLISIICYSFLLKCIRHCYIDISNSSFQYNFIVMMVIFFYQWLLLIFSLILSFNIFFIL